MDEASESQGKDEAILNLTSCETAARRSPTLLSIASRRRKYEHAYSGMGINGFDSIKNRYSPHEYHLPLHPPS